MAHPSAADTRPRPRAPDAAAATSAAASAATSAVEAELAVAQRLVAGMHERRIRDVLANPVLSKAWLSDELRIAIKRFPEEIIAPGGHGHRASVPGGPPAPRPSADGEVALLRSVLVERLRATDRFVSVRSATEVNPTLPCRCVADAPEHACVLKGTVGELVVTYSVDGGGTRDCIVFLSYGVDSTGFPRIAALAAAEYYSTVPRGAPMPEVLFLVVTTSDVVRGDHPLDLPGMVPLGVTLTTSQADPAAASPGGLPFGPDRVTAVSFTDLPSHPVAAALPIIIPAPVGQRPTPRLLRVLERPKDQTGHEECDMLAIAHWAAEQVRLASTPRPPPPEVEIDRSSSPVGKVDPKVTAPLPALLGTKPTPARVLTVEKSRTPPTPATPNGPGPPGDAAAPGRRKNMQMC